MANHAQGTMMDQQSITMTAQQLEHILKLIPKNGGSNQKGSETDEEIDYGFSGMVRSGKSKSKDMSEWIIDSGASDHMTFSLKNLENVKLAPPNFTINLPTGATAVIKHIGDVVLPGGLRLTDVLHVPQFNHNLLSIHKLAQGSRCTVVFHPNKCLIVDSMTGGVIGRGELKQGLYYLKNDKSVGMAMTGQISKEVRNNKEKCESENQFATWHKRLGHASISKLEHIDCVKPFLSLKKGTDMYYLSLV